MPLPPGPRRRAAAERRAAKEAAARLRSDGANTFDFVHDWAMMQARVPGIAENAVLLTRDGVELSLRAAVECGFVSISGNGTIYVAASKIVSGSSSSIRLARLPWSGR